MLKKFIATIAVAVCCLADPLPVRAQNNLQEDYKELWSTIQGIGVVTLINHKIHCDNPIFAGIYYTNGMLVICQENRKENNGIEIDWTNYDLDTLRHEAHHIVQDCAVGRVGDDKIGRMFTNDKELFKFIDLSSYTEDQIFDLYQKLSKNLSQEETLLEIEAYLVAKDIPANSIRAKIIDYCN